MFNLCTMCAGARENLASWNTKLFHDLTWGSLCVQHNGYTNNRIQLWLIAAKREFIKGDWKGSRIKGRMLNQILEWISTVPEAEISILWPPDVKNWLTGTDLVAGRDWRQEEKRMTEEEMVGWHHRLDGHEFEQALGVGDGQGSLVCYSPWGCKELDTTGTELNWTEYSSRDLGAKNSGKALPVIDTRETEFQLFSVLSHSA